MKEAAQAIIGSTENPWLSTTWAEFKLADGVAISEIMDLVLKTAAVRAKTSTRFCMVTVLKSYMCYFDYTGDDVFSLTSVDLCRATYPLFLDLGDLDNLYLDLDQSGIVPAMVKDLKRILDFMQQLSGDAFVVGTVLADIAGGTPRTKQNTKHV